METSNLGIDWTPGAMRSFNETERRILAYLYKHRSERVTRRDLALMLGRNGRTNRHDNNSLEKLATRGYIIERRRWKVERLESWKIEPTYRGGGTTRKPQRRRFWFVYEINPTYIHDWKRAQRPARSAASKRDTQRVTKKSAPKPKYINSEWTIFWDLLTEIIRRTPILGRLL